MAIQYSCRCVYKLSLRELRSQSVYYSSSCPRPRQRFAPHAPLDAPLSDAGRTRTRLQRRHLPKCKAAARILRPPRLSHRTDHPADSDRLPTASLALGHPATGRLGADRPSLAVCALPARPAAYHSDKLAITGRPHVEIHVHRAAWPCRAPAAAYRSPCIVCDDAGCLRAPRRSRAAHCRGRPSARRGRLAAISLRIAARVGASYDEHALGPHMVRSQLVRMRTALTTARSQAPITADTHHFSLHARTAAHWPLHSGRRALCPRTDTCAAPRCNPRRTSSGRAWPISWVRPPRRSDDAAPRTSHTASPLRPSQDARP